MPVGCGQLGIPVNMSLTGKSLFPLRNRSHDRLPGNYANREDSIGFSEWIPAQLQHVIETMLPVRQSASPRAWAEMAPQYYPSKNTACSLVPGFLYVGQRLVLLREGKSIHNY